MRRTNGIAPRAAWSLVGLTLLLAAACTSGNNPSDAAGDSGGAGAGNGGGGGGGNDDAADEGAPPDTASDPASPDDAPGPAPGGCPAGAKSGHAGSTNNIKTAGGLLFNVRTPSDYSPTAARPFLAVYSASGGDRNGMEQYTGLTPPALGHGMIIAYADHIDLNQSPDQVVKAALQMIDKVQADYCVDPHRIYITGWSDGATTLNELVRVTGPPLAVAAIAPVSAGTVDVNGACPRQSPFAAVVLHSSNDQLFPGRGRKVADYYIKCNMCNTTPLGTKPDGCLVYEGCKNGATVQYCEGTYSHPQFPKEMDAHVIDFLAAHPRP